MTRLVFTSVPRKYTHLLQRLLLFSFCFAPAAALSQASAVTATIDVTKTGAPISKNMYGQFLEHGGDIVNAGIWSEMLVDRKFFYPVSAVAPTPPPRSGMPREIRESRIFRSAGGRPSAATASHDDRKAPYAGDQSPFVRLSPSEPHGFRQSALFVRTKKTYTGRIVLGALRARWSGSR